VGTLPVLWSNPQSSQNRQFPVRGVPQFGHGVPVAAAGAGTTDAGALDSEETGVETDDGGVNTIVPPIFAPQVSQKSSVLEA
jgi:hypothetical protein